MVLNTTTTEVKIKEINNMKPQNILDLIGNTPLVRISEPVKNKNVKLLKTRRQQSRR
jgi:hypothetical protein